MKKKDLTQKKRSGNQTRRKVGAPPGRRQAGKRRGALLETAGKLFVAKGVESTTMDEIAASAHVAKGTLYHYFASKAELLDALREVFRSEFMSRIKTRVEACAADDWKARLRAWVGAAIDAYFDMSGLHDVVFHDAPTPQRHSMSTLEANRFLAKLIENGTRAGVWQADDPVWAATIMYYALHGGCDEVRLAGHSTEGVAEKLSTLFLRMLGVYDFADPDSCGLSSS